jgi:hypothetical protein
VLRNLAEEFVAVASTAREVAILEYDPYRSASENALYKERAESFRAALAALDAKARDLL